MANYTVSSRYRLSNGGRTADRVVNPGGNYYQYTSREGDTFPILAAKVLNDSSRYWEIADINPQLQWPDVIPTGTVLRIPT
jgi:nucleoid-associated protein YgaU